MQPLVLLNTVGLTSRLLVLAPRLSELARTGWQRPLDEIYPAVTCSAQATMLTGQGPAGHGIVGNGWLYRDTGEVRFWQQSNRLLQAEPLYATARRRAAEQGRRFRSAKLFWWFNQGAAVDISITPKPHYGADGNKAFDVLGTPEGLTDDLKRLLGPFPFACFWGPMAGLPATQWIAHAAAGVVSGSGDGTPPDLTLVYLPHLDYEPQRKDPQQPPPGGCDWPRRIGELDDACTPLLEAARKVGARVWLVNEYAHVAVRQPVLLNRALRSAGLLAVRPGPFGESLDTFASRAFAVCDHQLASVYVKELDDRERVRDLLVSLPGVDRVLAGPERADIGLEHERAGELIALAKPDAWFAYPFWLDDRLAPDYARTVDIHRKPGYDPCELFFDRQLCWPKGRALWRLLQKKLGFRTLFDVIALDATLVKGSHGLRRVDPADKPVFVGDGPAPASTAPLAQQQVHDYVLRALDLSER